MEYSSKPHSKENDRFTKKRQVAAPTLAIEEIYSANDGVILVVLVRTKTGAYKRPEVKV